MSLEQAILDRLEKRNAQIVQLQSTIQALERAADTQREHAMLERGLLVDENKNLAARIESAQLEREQMQHQITELRSEHDRILEISKSSVPKSALKQAVLDAAGLSSEVARLRAEIPLESTREALKNAVAKLQEVTTDRDRVLNELGAILAEANKSGRCGGDPVALLKQGQVDRDTAESLDRQLGAALALSNERAQEIRKLIDGHAEDMKAQAELAAQIEDAEVIERRERLIKSLNDEITKRDHELRAHEKELAESREEIRKLRAEVPLESTREALKNAVAKLQEVTTDRDRLQNEIVRLNAKVGPLEKLYEVVKKHVDNGAIIDNRADIYDAVAETAKALSQLTA